MSWHPQAIISTKCHKTLMRKFQGYLSLNCTTNTISTDTLSLEDFKLCGSQMNKKRKDLTKSLFMKLVRAHNAKESQAGN